ncbi:MAG: TIR domain-containing protein [Blastocatellia bacterium]
MTIERRLAWKIIGLIYEHSCSFVADLSSSGEGQAPRHKIRWRQKDSTLEQTGLAMAIYFFLSYARASDHGYVRKFFDELSQAIRDREGLGQTETVGFLDARNIELGRDWEPEIISALRRCPLLVCLYAPAYFKSEYCGREWEIFRQRRELYLEKRLRGAAVNAGEHAPAPLEVRPTEDIPRPPVIKPVIWIPTKKRQIPPIVAAVQYNRENHSPAYESLGLQFMRRHTEYRHDYDLFIEQLADDIVNTVENYDLPPLENAPLLREVSNPFFEEAGNLKRLTSEFFVRATQPFFKVIEPINRRAIKMIAALVVLSLIAVVIWISYNSTRTLDCGAEADYRNERIAQWTPEDLGWNLDSVLGKQGRRIAGDKAGLFKTATRNQFCIYRDFTLNFTVRFMNGKGVAWIIRARDFDNYYLFELRTSGNDTGKKEFNFYIREGGRLTLVESQPVTADIDQDVYSFFITTEAIGSQFTHSINVGGESRPLGIFKDERFSQGGVGFSPMNGMDVLVQHFLVTPK